MQLVAMHTVLVAHSTTVGLLAEAQVGVVAAVAHSTTVGPLVAPGTTPSTTPSICLSTTVGAVVEAPSTTVGAVVEAPSTTVGAVVEVHSITVGPRAERSTIPSMCPSTTAQSSIHPPASSTNWAPASQSQRRMSGTQYLTLSALRHTEKTFLFHSYSRRLSIHGRGHIGCSSPERPKFQAFTQLV